ncbi:hypothetical protein ACJX0J_020125, partial [Zea mays]
MIQHFRMMFHHILWLPRQIEFGKYLPHVLCIILLHLYFGASLLKTANLLMDDQEGTTSGANGTTLGTMHDQSKVVEILITHFLTLEYF